MGHTVWSQRIAMESFLAELRDFAKALPQEDRERFEQLLKAPMQRIGAISYASSIHLWAFALIAIILEQEKKIEKLENIQTTF